VIAFSVVARVQLTSVLSILAKYFRMPCSRGVSQSSSLTTILGNIIPSDEDRKVTRALKEAGAVLGITVLDHVIVSDDEFYSFSEKEAL